MTEDELKYHEDHACPTCGSCSGLFTANSMNCLCEALGIALPGNGTIPAVYSERHAPGEACGHEGDGAAGARHHGPRHRERGCHPQRHGMRHGLRRLHEHGAPPHGHRHARPAIPITMDDWDAASARTPHLVKLAAFRSATAHRPVRRWEACRWSCASWPNWACSTAAPSPAWARLDTYLETCTKPADGEVVPRARRSVLPGRRLARAARQPRSRRRHREEVGRRPVHARAYGPCARASTARKPRARPSTLAPSSQATSWSSATRALRAARACARCSTPTSSIVGQGPVDQRGARHRRPLLWRARRARAVGHVSPEAAAGGPIALVEDGDLVTVDIEGGALDAERGRRRAGTLAARPARPPAPKHDHGVLAKYARLVSSLQTRGRMWHDERTQDHWRRGLRPLQRPACRPRRTRRDEARSDGGRQGRAARPWQQDAEARKAHDRRRGRSSPSLEAEGVDTRVRLSRRPGHQDLRRAVRFHPDQHHVLAAPRTGRRARWRTATRAPRARWAWSMRHQRPGGHEHGDGHRDGLHGLGAARGHHRPGARVASSARTRSRSPTSWASPCPS